MRTILHICRKQTTKKSAKKAIKTQKQAAKLAGAEDNTAEDVVVFDDAKEAEKLKDFLRAANTVSHTVEETTEGEETKKNLTITLTGKTKDELMDEYSLTPRQRESVEILLENGDILTSSSHSLAITDADVQKSIINGLPDSLPQKRKDVDTCYRDIPAVDMTMFNRAKKLLNGIEYE